MHMVQDFDNRHPLIARPRLSIPLLCAITGSGVPDRSPELPQRYTSALGSAASRTWTSKGGLRWLERARQGLLLRRDLYLHASPIGSPI